MKRNIYTNRIVRPLENRKVSVFPAMEYCESCKTYSEGKCSNKNCSTVYFYKGRTNTPPFELKESDYCFFKTKEWFDLCMKV